MRFKPHPYQELAIKYILNKPKCGLLLDMGLGKTVITLTALEIMMYDSFEIARGSVLVIAPLRVAAHTWSAELDKWEHLKNLKISKVIGSEKNRLEALKAKADIYIINRENVVWLTQNIKWNFRTVIVDELSSFKNPSSKRFKALKKVSATLDRFIGLTGTPAPRSLMDLWPQIYLMDQGARLGRTFTQFRNGYFKPEKQNGYIVYSWKLRAGSEESIQSKISDICMSLTAADWLEVPKKIEVFQEVELDEKTKKNYKTFERDNYIQIVESEDPLVANNAGALANKLTQFTSGAVYNEDRTYQEVHTKKLEVLQELIDEANGQPVLVFYNFKHDHERINKYLKEYEPKTLRTSEDIDAWNRQEIPVLLAHPASMGHGLNLQRGGHIIIWFSLTWDLELYQQANARLHRQGQDRAVLVHHLIIKGTVDEDILKRLKNKNGTQQELIEAVKARLVRYGCEEQESI